MGTNGKTKAYRAGLMAARADKAFDGSGADGWLNRTEAALMLGLDNERRMPEFAEDHGIARRWVGCAECYRFEDIAREMLMAHAVGIDTARLETALAKKSWAALAQRVERLERAVAAAKEKAK